MSNDYDDAKTWQLFAEGKTKGVNHGLTLGGFFLLPRDGRHCAADTIAHQLFADGRHHREEARKPNSAKCAVFGEEGHAPKDEAETDDDVPHSVVEVVSLVGVFFKGFEVEWFVHEC